LFPDDDNRKAITLDSGLSPEANDDLLSSTDYICLNHKWGLDQKDSTVHYILVIILIQSLRYGMKSRDARNWIL
jgi:hypothetical protein